MSFVWTAGMMNPEVLRGQLVVKDNTYKLAAGQSFKKGELIRITNAEPSKSPEAIVILAARFMA